MTADQFDQIKEVVFDDVNNYKNYRQCIIGDFLPSVLRTKDFEVGVFYMEAGEKTPKHHHLECLEINVIITGECLVKSNGLKHRLKDGEIFTFPKGVNSECEYTKDTTVIVIKTPSVPTDKILVQPNWDDEG